MQKKIPNSALLAERDKILFGETYDWSKREQPPGISVRIDDLTVEKIEKLIELGFISPSQRMNSSPPVTEFLLFGTRMKWDGYEFCFEAFFFAPEYDDGRVAIEGICFNGNYPAEIGLEFAQFAAAYQPDELTLKSNMLRAWWD